MKCQWCGGKLQGRQVRWCSSKCRIDAFHVSRADYYLSALPQKEFREAIRRACNRRWPKGHSTNRIKIRFGKYNPRA